jgi:hypothetical protein
MLEVSSLFIEFTEPVRKEILVKCTTNSAVTPLIALNVRFKYLKLPLISISIETSVRNKCWCTV